MRTHWNKLASISLAASLAAAAMFSQAGCESDEGKASKEVAAAMASTEGGDAVTRATKAAQIKGAAPNVSILALQQLAEAEANKAVALINQIETDEVRIAQHVGAINRIAAHVAANNSLALGYKQLEPTKAKEAVEAEKKKASEGQADGVWVPHASAPLPSVKAIDQQLTEIQGKLKGLQDQVAGLNSKREQAIGQAEELEKQSNAQSGRQSLQTYEQSAAARKQALELAAQIAQVEAQILPVQQDLKLAEDTKKQLSAALASFDQLAAANDAKWQEAQQSIKELTDLSRQLVEGGGGGAASPSAPVERSAPKAPGADARRRNGLVRFAMQATPAPAGDAAPAPAPAGDAAPAPAPAGDAAPAPAPAPTPAPTRAPAPAPAGDGDTAPAAKSPTDKPLPGSIAENAAAIKALSGNVAANRAQAEQLLKSANDHLTQAIALANTYGQTLRNKVQGEAGQKAVAAAWKGELSVFNPNSLKLRQASVQLQLARLHRTTAAEYASRAAALKTVEGVVKDASLTSVPADLNDASITDGGKGALDAAKAANDEAKKLLEDVKQASSPISGPDPLAESEKRTAHVRSLVEGLSEAAVAGQTDPAAAAKALAGVQSDAKGGDATVPAAELPAYLQDALGLNANAKIASATSPTTGPATGPAGATAGANADNPDQAAVRAAAVAFAGALMKGDAAAAQAAATLGPQNDLLIASWTELYPKHTKLVEALLNKWPDKERDISAMRIVPDILAAAYRGAITLNGDTATLATVGDQPLTLKKDSASNAWKVELNFPVSAVQLNASLTRGRIAAIDTVMAGLAANKYATPADVQPDLAVKSAIDGGQPDGATPAPAPSPAPADGATPAPAPAPADGTTPAPAPAPADGATPAPADTTPPTAPDTAAPAPAPAPAPSAN